ncbi:MAG: UDP-N-acetylmuramoyl-L-alanyl-D-glutamate--2,6-diaminopimelate ligase [Anaerolineales bacterium]
MQLSQLLIALPHLTARTGEGDPDITAITHDSRQVTPGTLFVATRGANFDGHHFIREAIAKGAAAIVMEQETREIMGNEGNPDLSRLSPVSFISVPNSREALGWLAAAWHRFPSRKLVLIGVTGTDGKTTTATLIHSILKAAGIHAGLISTVSAVIGNETLDTGFHVTTPEALEIQGYLARMAADGLTHAVLETTSHGLAQHRVTGCEYDIAVVTNITHEHLDEHGSYENYRAAKGRLFEMLSTAARKPGVEKTGVLNADDSSFEYLSGVLKEKRLSYGVRQTADVVAHHIEYRPNSTQFNTSISELQFSISLMGAFNVSNCLAALAATVGVLGIAPEAAQRGIAELRGVPGRMERIDLGQPFTALVDFAHTPNALRRALETARQMLTAEAAPIDYKDAPPARLYKPRVIAVFGSAGLRDVEKRRLMAETSAELADITVLTAEDPRTESLDDILEMMAFGARTKGGVEGVSFFRVPDRGEAIRLAVRLAQPGDIVLACGKGHEQSMCFGLTEYAWDDRTALRAALAEVLGVPGPTMPILPTSPR